MTRWVLEDLTGQNFGQLSVTKHLGNAVQGKASIMTPALWLCICSCGSAVQKTSDQLKKGKARKCRNCENRKRSASSTQCLIYRIESGVKKYLDPSVQMFTRKSDSSALPCNQAAEIARQLNHDYYSTNIGTEPC